MNNTNQALQSADPGDVLAFKEAVLDKLKTIYDEFGIISNLEARGMNFTFSTTMGQLRQFGGVDSLDEIEAIMMIEEEFEHEIADETAETWINVGDVIEYLTEATYGKWTSGSSVGMWGIVRPNPAPAVVDEEDEVLVDTTSTSVPVPASTPSNDDSALGVLHMPSLEDHDRMITTVNISIKEAKEVMKEFALKVEDRRKIKYYKDNTDMDTEHSEWFYNFFDKDKIRDFSRNVDVEQFSADLNGLATSDIPTYRGKRPLFIGDDVIAVGTTVIYNQNWATINFPDNTVMGKIIKIGEDHDLI
jgi:acyl carrier protein